ncbi:spermidine synthase [Paenibacillus sp. y28]|uniref:spermidine synthase n=1 Tax=Paenibacillus sp. y28 TaxID=3129110 RepID=UPI003FA6F96B
MHILTKASSSWNEISVLEATQLYGEMGKFRFLQFSDHAVQGAIDLKNPQRIVLEYPRAMMHLMEFNRPSFDSVFMIGHGIGTIPGHYPDKQFTVAEIDEKVVEISKAFFDYRLDNVVIGDGRDILSRQQPEALDYIIVDAFTKKGTPLHLMTTEFFDMTANKLAPHGAVLLNLMGRANHDKLLHAVHTTLRQTYAYTTVFCLPGRDAADLCNMILMGSHKPAGYKPKSLAGFVEIELDHGYVMMDNTF